MSASKKPQKTLPAPVYNVLREGRDAAVRASQWPAATFIPGGATASSRWQR
jgi:hypothetical protein